jgi:hypothetical protein
MRAKVLHWEVALVDPYCEDDRVVPQTRPKKLRSCSAHPTIAADVQIHEDTIAPEALSESLEAE